MSIKDRLCAFLAGVPTDRKLGLVLTVALLLAAFGGFLPLGDDTGEVLPH
ncbi:MAG: hypothetical protein ACE5KH_06065 [Candidatus Geothermarchaeales archaeon]